MKITGKEIALYVIIAAVVVVAVAVYLTYYTALPVSVKVTISQLGPQRSFYPYQSASYTVTVNNTGTTNINNMYVAVYVNGQPQSSYSRYITLPHGTSASYNITTLFSSNGTYNYEAIADPAKVLDVQDRSSAQSTLSTVVLSVSAPNIYTSIPNANITSTKSFTLQGSQGEVPALAPLVFITKAYSGTPAAHTVGIGNLTRQLFSLMSSSSSSSGVYIGEVNGAYATYSNSSSAYTAWLESSINSTLLNALVSSLAAKPVAFTAQGGTAYYVKENSTTSLCYLFSGGWTKLVEFDNNSASGTTCEPIASATYAATEPAKLVAALKVNPAVPSLLKEISYSNFSTTSNSLVSSSQLGTMLMLNGSSFAGANITAGPPGYFITYATNNVPPLNLSVSHYCAGRPFIEQYSHICSIFVTTRNVAAGANSSIVLVNSTEFNSNYTAMLYSLVNVSTRFTAVNSGIQLFLGSNFTSTNSQWWNSTWQNHCTFPSNTPLNCSVNFFVHNSAIANLTFYSTAKNPVSLITLGCFYPGTGASEFNYSVAKNATLTQGAYADVFCKGYAPGDFLGTTLYTLDLTYLHNGTMYNETGTLNIST